MPLYPDSLFGSKTTAPNTSLNGFGLPRPWIEPMAFRIQGERANLYITEVVFHLLEQSISNILHSGSR